MDKSRWVVALMFGAVVLFVVLAGCGLLLALAGLWRFGSHGGMMGGGCPWCGGTGALGGGEIAAMLALLFVVLTGLGLLGLLVLGGMWLARRGRGE